MAKFIIDQALLLRTIVEVEAEDYNDFVRKHVNGEYEELINEEQMQWNVEDLDEQLFDGSYEDHKSTLLKVIPCKVSRTLDLEWYEEDYKREFLKTKLK